MTDSSTTKSTAKSAPKSKAVSVRKADPQAGDNLRELGSTGLKRSGGRITEEFLPELNGVRGRRVYREMSDNDPIIGGIQRAFEEVLGRLNWRFEPGEDADGEDEAITEFVQSCFEDMNDSWDVTLSSIMSMVPYGWAFHEVVYKQRGGSTVDPRTRSRFDDGRIGWRKWAIRSQDTLSEWVFDENGGLRGMMQNDPNAPRVEGLSANRFIPINKALLFRTREFKGNPEGVSLFRTAYRPWYYKKRIEEIEAVGIERDLAGLPVVYAPPSWFSSTASADEKNSLKAMQAVAQGAKRNELEGVVLPMVIDGEGNQLVKFELLSSGGSRSFSTNEVITRWNNQIATSVLADYMTLGHEQTGSYALGTAKISLWMMVVESLAKSIAEVINKHAVPKLLRLNGMNVENPPQLVFGTVEQIDLAVLGDFITKMFDAGMLTPDDRLEAYVRELADLPPIDEATQL